MTMEVILREQAEQYLKEYAQSLRVNGEFDQADAVELAVIKLAEVPTFYAAQTWSLVEPEPLVKVTDKVKVFEVAASDLGECTVTPEVNQDSFQWDLVLEQQGGII